MQRYQGSKSDLLENSRVSFRASIYDRNRHTPAQTPAIPYIHTHKQIDTCIYMHVYLCICIYLFISLGCLRAGYPEKFLHSASVEGSGLFDWECKAL